MQTEAQAKTRSPGRSRWRNRLSAGCAPSGRMDEQVCEIVESFAAPIREASGPIDLVAAFRQAGTE